MLSSILLYQGPVLGDRTHHFVTSPVLEDFLRVSYLGVFKYFMPAPSTRVLMRMNWLSCCDMGGDLCEAIT